MLLEYPRIAAQIEMFITWSAGPVVSSGRVCVSVPTKSTESGVEESVLPPGQRDDSGFWYPSGYNDPSMLVRPRRRRRNPEPAEAETTPSDDNGAGNSDH